MYRAAEFTAAREYFDHYLRVEPDHVISLEYRARLLRDAGEYAASVADYERLFSLIPMPDPGHYISVARMMVALPERGTDDALALLDRRMEEVGVLSQLQRYAIELERRRQHYEGAITRLETLDPRLRATPEWKVEMGELQLQAGHRSQAQSYLEAAEQQLRVVRPTVARRDLHTRLKKLLEDVKLHPEH